MRTTSCEYSIKPHDNAYAPLMFSAIHSVRPTQIVIPNDVAPHFLVTDVKVGRNSQFLSAACVPASFFAESSPRDDLLFEILQPGMMLALSVTNISDVSREFRCTVRGQAAASPHDGCGSLCGLGYTEIPPGESASINTQSQVVFAPDRLFIPRDVLEKTTIHRISKLNAYVVESLQPVPRPILNPNPQRTADVPSSELTRENLLGDGCFRLQPNPIVTCNDLVVIDVTNDSKEPLWFCGALVGKIYP